MKRESVSSRTTVLVHKNADAELVGEIMKDLGVLEEILAVAVGQRLRRLVGKHRSRLSIVVPGDAPTVRA